MVFVAKKCRENINKIEIQFIAENMMNKRLAAYDDSKLKIDGEIMHQMHHTININFNLTNGVREQRQRAHLN